MLHRKFRSEEPAIAIIHCEICKVEYDHRWLLSPPRSEPWRIFDGYCQRCKSKMNLDYVPMCSEQNISPTLIMERK